MVDLGDDVILGGESGDQVVNLVQLFRKFQLSGEDVGLFTLTRKISGIKQKYKMLFIFIKIIHKNQGKLYTVV